MKTTKLLSLAAAFSAIFASAAQAAPSVSGVTGTPATGQSIRITGGGFGVKSPAAPHLWADFESGINPSGLGQKSSWDTVGSMTWAAGEGYKGTGAAKASNSSGNWTLGTTYDAWSREGQRSYIYKRTRHNFLVTDTSQNWKNWRAWAESGKPNIYFASNNGRAYVEYIGQESGFWGDFNPNSTNWVSEEILLQASSSINVKDGRLTYRVDGVNKANGSVMTRSSVAPDYITQNYALHSVLANSSLWSPSWSSNNRVWADNIYVDTTWARVMIGDASTFTSSRNLDIQIPTAWADGSITVVANTPSFSSGSRAYLYVFDAAGNVNANGYAITIGQGGTVSNQAPSVSAGANQEATIGSAFQVTGTASDDGLPNPPASVSTTWSHVSGPATASFASASSKTTAVTFPSAGTYVLRLTASDGSLSASDDVTVTVNAVQPVNLAPLVNAGANATITLPAGAQLSGTATDDGLPSGTVTTAWSQVSGPTGAQIQNAAAGSTAVSFTQSGTYVFRLTANDGALGSTDDVQITVQPAPPVNAAPSVSAGGNVSVTLGNAAQLTGSVTDDGLPSDPGTLATTWSKVSGPAGEQIQTAASRTTTVTFTQAGTYVFRLTADDGALSATDDVQVTVQPVSPSNVSPNVNAGADTTGRAGQSVSLSGSVSDDGLPNPPGATTVQWTSVSGPATPSISDADSLSTSVMFPSAGLYVLRLTANDGALSGVDDVAVDVDAASPTNFAPSASAGGDQVVVLPNKANFSAAGTDDGLPSNQLSYLWAKVSGPGTVAFGDVTAPTTWASFSVPGLYILALTLSDGQLSATDEVAMDVRPQLTADSAPVVSGLSGRLTNGQQLQVVGSNFGEKSPAAPLIYADFENGLEPSSLGQIRNWSNVENMERTNEGFDGSKGAKASDGNGVWTLRVDRDDWTKDGQRLYVHRRSRLNFVVTSESQNWKSWRMWGESFGYPNIYAAPNNGRVFVENTGTESGFWGSFRQNTTNWSTEEILMQASSAIDLKDGLLALRYDGVEKARGSILTKSSVAPATMEWNYVVHGVVANRPSWSPDWSTNNRMWVDDVYVDNTWARVMLGDAPTYASSRKFDIQIPTGWSNGSVTFVARTNSFAKNDRAYLYVFDKDGRVNENGYPVTVDSRHLGSLVDGGSLPGDSVDETPRNVFNPARGEQASLAYALRERGSVKVLIYDRGGRRVKELTGADVLQGQHTISWDGRNDEGSLVASGIYIAVARGSEGTRSRHKIAVIK